MELKTSTHSVSVVKNPPAVQETCRRYGFHPWVRKIPWRRKQQSAPVILPGESNGRRSPVGKSPWGRKESGATEHTGLQPKDEGAVEPTPRRVQEAGLGR